MKKKKGKWKLLVLSLISGLLFTGCGSSGSSTFSFVHLDTICADSWNSVSASNGSSEFPFFIYHPSN